MGSFRDALFAEMGDPKTDGERLRRISPLFNAARIKAPLMVLQGANDPRVHQVESDGRNRRGRHATTVKDITDAADVGKGTFFNYFPSDRWSYFTNSVII